MFVILFNVENNTMDQFYYLQFRNAGSRAGIVNDFCEAACLRISGRRYGAGSGQRQSHAAVRHLLGSPECAACWETGTRREQPSLPKRHPHLSWHGRMSPRGPVGRFLNAPKYRHVFVVLDELVQVPFLTGKKGPHGAAWRVNRRVSL